jgi:hypothetical protein
MQNFQAVNFDWLKIQKLGELESRETRDGLGLITQFSKKIMTCIHKFK